MSIISHHLNKKLYLGDIYRVQAQNTDMIQQFLDMERPVVIKGLIDTWPARILWTLDYLEKVCNNSNVNYVPLDANNRTAYKKISNMPFSEFFRSLKDILCNEPHYNKYKKLYLTVTRIMTHPNRDAPQLPQLLKDIEIPNFIPIKRLWSINLWLGAGGNTSYLHFDPDQNILTVLKGSKKFILFPPSEAKLLYQNTSKNTNRLMSSVDIFDNIDTTKYPKIFMAKYYEVEIKEGESIYIPPGWWHAVISSKDLNLAVNFWWLVKPMCLLKFSRVSSRQLWRIKNKWLCILFPNWISKYIKPKIGI